ncbi:NTP transferase domain-containing protein [Mangrovibacterium sp.]|uniref:nucleotidyltransferase family protein n=1 Tax=Mangrovibacterium sp. TaxID=1961364 RepID=UPI0035691A23
MAEISILLLAAGSSSRMGQPKQLLPWGSYNLIEFQIQQLLNTGYPVFVVLGSQSAQTRPFVERYPATVLLNKDWPAGMGSSISAAITQMTKKFPETEGILITLIDQPMVSAVHLKKMIENFNPNRIVASRSKNGWQGVPALFGKSYFDDLKKLNGEKGAKRLITDNNEWVICVDSDSELEDMDTREKYQEMLAAFLKSQSAG